MPAKLGQLKTGQDGKGLLRIHLWCPDDLPRLWDRIEKIDSLETVERYDNINLTSSVGNLSKILKFEMGRNFVKNDCLFPKRPVQIFRMPATFVTSLKSIA